MPDDLRKDLQERMKIFIHEKVFVGFEGMEITEQMKVVIASQACLLILNRPTNYYGKLYQIRVYPHNYFVRENDHEDGVTRVSEKAVLGRSTRGTVELAWHQSLNQVRNFRDGQNVSIHEFAHQLDQADGNSDGAPELKKGQYNNWANVFKAEYMTLHQQLQRHQKTFLDDYAATNPAEFFAVASEHFFEQPKLMQKKHQELYDCLVSFYHINPAEW